MEAKLPDEENVHSEYYEKRDQEEANMTGSDAMEHEQKNDGTKIINPETGEIIEEMLPVLHKDKSGLPDYYRMSEAAFDEKKQKKLRQKLTDDEIEIDPQGMLYFPQIRYRNRLNDTFGIGAWALRPREMKVQGNTIMFMGELWVEGRFISFAVGEQEYHENNPIMSYATALEAAKSDCLTRCCKDLGIATELWDPTFTKQWKEKNAIQVWCVHAKNGNKKLMWRKPSYPPFEYPWSETGVKKTAERTETAVESTQKPKAKVNAKKAQTQQDAPRDDKLTFQQKQKLVAGMLNKMFKKAEYPDKLQSYSSFETNDGIRSLSQLKPDNEKWLNTIIGKVSKDFIEQFGDNSYEEQRELAKTNI